MRVNGGDFVLGKADLHEPCMLKFHFSLLTRVKMVIREGAPFV